jgi:hypothetical protein
MTENEYPKEDGDAYYGSEANQSIYDRKGTVTNYGAVTIGTSATQIVAADADRCSIIIYNNSGQTVYIGDSGVTTADGFPLLSGADITFYDTDAIYADAVSSADDVRYLEVSK